LYTKSSIKGRKRRDYILAATTKPGANNLPAWNYYYKWMAR